MLTKLRVSFLIIGFVLVTSSAMAAPLWDFQSGQRAVFNKSIPGPVNWTMTVNILHTDMVQGQEYFHLEINNEDNNGGIDNSYWRSTETEIWLKEDRCPETLRLKTDAPGNTWTNGIYDEDQDCENVGTETCSIVSTDPITVPANTFPMAYRVSCDIDFGGGPQTVLDSFFVPGVGLVREVDSWEEDPETFELAGMPPNAIIATYPNGLFKFDGTWTRINSGVPSNIVGYGNVTYAVFPGGLYKHNGTTWTRIHPTVPAAMVVAGSNLYVSFTGSGLYKYSGTTWTRIHTTVPANIVGSGATLYASFAGSGLYKYNGFRWAQISTNIPNSIVVGRRK